LTFSVLWWSFVRERFAKFDEFQSGFFMTFTLSRISAITNRQA
jgi:hypothetical protein